MNAVASSSVILECVLSIEPSDNKPHVIQYTAIFDMTVKAYLTRRNPQIRNKRSTDFDGLLDCFIITPETSSEFIGYSNISKIPILIQSIN